MPRTTASFLLTLALAGVGTALGEEIFFRRPLAGVLIRRLGFLRGNVDRAGVFAAVHLLVVLVHPELGFFAFVCSFIAALVTGWFYWKTKSILPS